MVEFLSNIFKKNYEECLLYDDTLLSQIKNIKNYDACILLGDHSANDLNEILKIIPRIKRDW